MSRSADAPKSHRTRSATLEATRERDLALCMSVRSAGSVPTAGRGLPSRITSAQRDRRLAGDRCLPRGDSSGLVARVGGEAVPVQQAVEIAAPDARRLRGRGHLAAVAREEIFQIAALEG